MKKSTDSRIGISVNKNNAERKVQMRDTVFRKGSSLNSHVGSHKASEGIIGYTYLKSNSQKR